MEHLKINFIHLCENAFFSEDKKLSVIEIFDTIGVPSVPAMQPNMAIAINVAGTISDEGAIVIESPSNEEVLTFPLTSNTLDSTKSTNNVVIKLKNFPITEQGEYKIFIRIGDTVIGSGKMVLFTAQISS